MAWLMLLCFAQRSEASCGDYLIEKHDSTHRSQAAAQLTTLWLATSSPAQPCDGPSCKGDSAPSHAFSTTVEISTKQNVGALRKLSSLADHEQVRGDVASIGATVRQGFPESIEHPPRS